ncbi:hypothetical protein PROFUN_06093 [Planoprotostelium fungivorum]|uniref:Uncharacterized protein n=1 Tax=Planoprotostelium fungivorum TaxID=1890364 RepID=A0A2P6NPT1_9EUKA|nr:hypothetical protein PROFUN_06093 [Planoprotostelium fungivorum]
MQLKQASSHPNALILYGVDLYPQGVCSCTCALGSHKGRVSWTSRWEIETETPAVSGFR